LRRVLLSSLAPPDPLPESPEQVYSPLVDPASALTGLLRRKSITLDDEIAFAKHLSAIRERLRGSAYRLKRIGSMERGTALEGASDLDVLLLLPAELRRHGGREVSSDTILKNVRLELKGRSVPSVDRDRQSLVAQFDRGKYLIDVVPAFFTSMSEHSQPLYSIPDGDGGWLLTSPAAHNAFIDAAHERGGKKLKGVVRLIKWWRESRARPPALASFHLELLLASELRTSVSTSYSNALAEAFALLAARDGNSLEDPLGLSGEIPAAKTRGALDPLRTALQAAMVHATKAVLAEQEGDDDEACEQWDILFNRALFS
jgi:hypothetical protein